MGQEIGCLPGHQRVAIQQCPSMFHMPVITLAIKPGKPFAFGQCPSMFHMPVITLA